MMVQGFGITHLIVELDTLGSCGTQPFEAFHPFDTLSFDPRELGDGSPIYFYK